MREEALSAGEKEQGEQDPSLGQILSTMMGGMRTTAKEALRQEVTEEYPLERPPLPWGTKSQLHVDIVDCIACFKCAQACPSDCIRIECVRTKPGAQADTTDGHKRMFEVVRFDIDMGQCCYCGLCTGRSSYVPAGMQNDPTALAVANLAAACPTDCINFYARFENGTHDARHLIYHFAAHPFDEARDLWRAAPAKERRSTHQERAGREYETGPLPGAAASASASPAGRGSSSPLAGESRVGVPAPRASGADGQVSAEPPVQRSSS